MSTETEYEKGFTAGVWYAVEILTLYQNNAKDALFIIEESGIKKWEFEKQLKINDYEVETLTKLIIEKIK